MCLCAKENQVWTYRWSQKHPCQRFGFYHRRIADILSFEKCNQLRLATSQDVPTPQCHHVLAENMKFFSMNFQYCEEEQFIFIFAFWLAAVTAVVMRYVVLMELF